MEKAKQILHPEPWVFNGKGFQDANGVLIPECKDTFTTAFCTLYWALLDVRDAIGAALGFPPKPRKPIYW